jgi:hypothetical protein
MFGNACLVVFINMNGKNEVITGPVYLLSSCIGHGKMVGAHVSVERAGIGGGTSNALSVPASIVEIGRSPSKTSAQDHAV